MLELAIMPPGEVTACVTSIFEGYVVTRVRAGEDPASAQRNADEQRRSLFPDGAPAEGQHLMNVLDEGTVVGHLWLGRPFNAAPGTWFVFDVEVREEFRGRGYGRATMEAAERWALDHDGVRLSLNVFGPNTVARSLYDSLGYQAQATLMFKDLVG